MTNALKNFSMPLTSHLRTVGLRYGGSFLLVAVCGCGWWLRITEVSGTVRVDGQPAKGVRLVFEPVNKSIPRAMALTDKDGRYRLGRQGSADKMGAAAGKYDVRVMSDSEVENSVAIPAEYSTKSMLQFDVIPGKANVFDIDVKTKK